MRPRVPGCCVFCDTEVQGSRRTWDDGTPRLLSQPNPGSVQMTVLLIQSGRTANMTRCGAEGCSAAAQLPRELLHAWRRCVATEAQNFDPDYRKATQRAPLTEDERKKLAVTLSLQLSDPPVGLLVERPWEEVIRGSIS
jgi:hypothetical protein